MMKRIIFIQIKYLYLSRFTLNRDNIELMNIVEILKIKIASEIFSQTDMYVNKDK